MKKLFENTWVEDDQGVRIFLLAGKEKALVIDTGMTGLDVHGMVSAHTDLPYQLLTTHADGDHIGSHDQFDEFYMHPSEAFFYRQQKRNGKIIPVYEGDVIDLGGRELEIIHLPGHTPGSITVLDRNNRCLIGGDPVQVDGNIFMFASHRNMEAYISSLERLIRRDDFDWVYPSHATEKVSRDVIPQLIDSAKKILSGELRGEEIEVFGTRVLSCDAGVSHFIIDL